MQLKTKVFLIIIFFSINSTFSQIVYSGTIGKYPVEFVIQSRNSYPDSQNYEGTYMYCKYHNPIYLTGAFKKNLLHFEELDHKQKKTAVITFNNYFVQADSVLGEWKDIKTDKHLLIKLKREYEFKNDYNSSNNYLNRELLQSNHLKNYYFKLLVSKGKEGGMTVDGIRLYSKKSNDLFQELNLPDCEFSLGINSVSFEDCDPNNGDTCFTVYQMTSFNPAIEHYLHFIFDPDRNEFTLQENDVGY